MTAYKIVDVGAHRGHPLAHFGRTKLRFGLAFEYRLHHFDRKPRNDRLAHIGGIEILLIKIADGFYICLFESIEVRTPLCSVLSVYERVILLAVLAFAVGDSHLDILACEVNDGIKKILFVIIFGEEVFKSVFGIVFLAVIVNRKPRVEVYVVFEHTHYVLIAEFEVFENGIIRNKSDTCTTSFLSFFYWRFFFYNSPFKRS